MSQTEIENNNPRSNAEIALGQLVTMIQITAPSGKKALGVLTSFIGSKDELHFKYVIGMFKQHIKKKEAEGIIEDLKVLVRKVIYDEP